MALFQIRRKIPDNIFPPRFHQQKRQWNHSGNRPGKYCQIYPAQILNQRIFLQNFGKSHQQRSQNHIIESAVKLGNFPPLYAQSYGRQNNHRKTDILRKIKLVAQPKITQQRHADLPQSKQRRYN